MRRSPLTISLFALLLACEPKPTVQQSEPKPQPGAAEKPSPASTSSSGAPAPPSKACENLAFFDIYRQAGAVAKESNEAITLDLRIDLHAADCGAPDSYGHDTRLVLQLKPDGERCRAISAKATHAAFGDKHYRDEREKWESNLVPDGQTNLATSNSESFVLRSAESNEAIRLSRTNYYFYEGVKPNQKLAEGLQGDSSPQGPAYGYTSSDSSRWRTTYWLSPLTFSSAVNVEKNQLDEYNRWATNNRLRNELPALLERTFLSREEGGETKTKFSGGKPPTAATVTYDRKLAAADPKADANSLERRTLLFSRKLCDDCPEGATGWWLWSAKTEWHCAADDGKLERSEYRCGSWEQVNVSARHQLGKGPTNPAE